jgi:hypothetical protein
MAEPTNPLCHIKNFEQLIRYLEEELDWPCEEYGFDEITFRYSPAELGIKEEEATQIKCIHQLRPFFQGQPWGIFFIEFEKKRIPIVLLRRVLSHLVIKKRASANKAETAAWNTDNLLFISAFGEVDTERREIAFAHFHQEQGDLPTLRVLGWDGADTMLKMEYVAKTLKERLHWPTNPRDVNSWREQWTGAFIHKPGFIIKTANELAERLAELARGIRDAAQTLMAHETEKGRLRSLHKAFQTALIHDLSEGDFADTYAQTITYGLLTAAISRTDMSAGRYGTALVAENVTDMVPITNPFLRDMLKTFLQAGGRKGGIDFDELGIQDVVNLLRGEETDLPAVLRDFGNRAPGEDPVIHFYEHFLSAYNKKLKIQRGVFYTPKPVVSYIVRSVHELLLKEFGLEDGLASIITWGEMVKLHPEIKLPEGVSPDAAFVVVLDPATGTATFLVEIIDVVYKTMVAKWKKQGYSDSQIKTAWNEYVPKHLLPRLYGYELMMAPYAIAHMKIGLKLYETGYRFGSDERVRVYLTNSLEPSSEKDMQMTFDFNSPALAHEAQAVNVIKRNQFFTVIIGNPPYSKIGRNMGEWASNLVKLDRIDGVEIQSYYKVDGTPLGERKVWLQDDYVKFMRLAQYCIKRSGVGIYGYITNRGFLGNPTFNGMRQSLSETFANIDILDLHGDTNVGEISPDGKIDQNVFDIQQGVAISIGTRLASSTKLPGIRHGDLWGKRADKYSTLSVKTVQNIKAYAILFKKPLYLFLPLNNQDSANEFEGYWLLSEIMPRSSSGIVTSKDGFVIGFSDDEIIKRVEIFLNPNHSDKKVGELLNLSENYSWRISTARTELRKDKSWKDKLTSILYRPFDVRRIIMHESIVWRTRKSLMNQMHTTINLGLLATRQSTTSFSQAFCTRHSIEMKACSHDRNTELFPLWIILPPQESLIFKEEPQANFNVKFLKQLEISTGLAYSIRKGTDNTFDALSVFYYIYAILYSKRYRQRYESHLSRSYPRIPGNPSKKLFEQLSTLGNKLVELHLLEAPVLEKSNIKIAEKGDNLVASGFPDFQDGTVFINAHQGFSGVTEEVWNFHIGGYQACHKWLKDRRGRQLSKEDIAHYKKIVNALGETIRLMGEVDEAIESAGGWPIK